MNTLLSTCYITWGIYFWGKDLIPSVFRNFYVFWGVNIGLIVLLSIGFAKSLSIYFQTKNKKIQSITHSAWFLLLFLLIIILPITVHHTMESFNTFSDRMLRIMDTSPPETEERRKKMASFIFSQYGLQIPYRLDSGAYETFQPTEKQEKKYEVKLESNKETIELGQKLSRISWLSSKLAIIQAVLFFVVFVGTILYEQKQENNNS